MKVEKDSARWRASRSKTFSDLVAAAAHVRNNGGGFWNHDFSGRRWHPKAGRPRRIKLAQAIDRDFGGLDKLKDEVQHQGRGPVPGRAGRWLIADEGEAERY